MNQKPIKDLGQEIYKILDNKTDHSPCSTTATSHAMNIGNEMLKATTRKDRPREKGVLWASDLGKPCLRQHWYNFNMPEAGEPLQGHTKFKFLYGNLLEEAALYLASEAGYEVTDLQKEVEYELPDSDWKIRGRMDASINGIPVDVKSASSFAFKKYKYGIDPSNDSFGYIDQLGFYHRFSDTTSEVAGFVFVDKQNGHVKFVGCETPTKEELVQKAEKIIQAVEAPMEPGRWYRDKPYGKSGNMTLDISCQYCPFKQECWKDANNGQGLRTFLYNQGPVDFTEIKREPNVTELTK